MIEIKNIGGTTVVRMPDEANGVFLQSAIRSEVDMQGDTVTIVASSRAKLNIAVGCSIVVDGRVYRMNQVPRMVRSGAQLHHQYTLVFESAKYDLANVIFQLPNNTVGDYLTGNMQTILNCIVDNANRVYPGQWVAGTIVGATEVNTEQYTGMTCLSALQYLCENYEKKFRISEANGVKTINIISDGSNIANMQMEYGNKGGLYQLERQATASEDVATRLYVYGSSENLPTGYRYTRLCLPNKTRNTSYVENASKISLLGTKEAIEYVDDVKPRATFTITSKLSRTKFRCDALAVGQTYGFKLDARWAEEDYSEWLEMRGYTNTDDVFALFTSQVVGANKYLTQGVAHVTWNTGALAGRTFSIKTVSDDGATLEINEVKENSGDVQLERVFPTSGGAFDIGIGDEIVISDIELPMALVHRAESELQTRAASIYGERSEVCARYAVEIDALSAIDRSKFIVGDYIKVKDTEIDVNKYLLIESKDVDMITGDVSIVLSDFKKMTWMSNQQPDEEEADISVGGVGTSLTSIFTPNYDGYVNKVRISDGKFTDSSLMGKRKVWDVYERTITDLETYASYDVFIKASKLTTYASVVFLPKRADELVSAGEAGSTTAQSIVSKLKTSGDESCFYVRIGSLSKAYVPEGATKAVRAMELRYGSVSSASDNTAHVDDAINEIEDIRTIEGLKAFDDNKAYKKGDIVSIDGQMVELTADYLPGMTQSKAASVTPASSATDIVSQIVKAKHGVYSWADFTNLRGKEKYKVYIVTGEKDDVYRVYIGMLCIYENDAAAPLSE